MITIKRTVAVFADLSSYEPKSDLIITLMQSFMKRGLSLLPSTTHEVVLPNPTAVPRLKFASADETLSVSLGSDKLEITTGHFNLQPPGAVANVFQGLLQACLEIFIEERGLRGSRMAYVTGTLIPSQSDSEMFQHYRRFFTFPKPFADETVVEWNARALVRAPLKGGRFSETVNIAMGVQKAAGIMIDRGISVRFAGIIFQSDVNSIPEDGAPRFDFDYANDFAVAADEKTNELVTEFTKQAEGS